MKAFWEAYKKALRRGLLVLLLVWAVWYARPLDVYDLMGGEPPEYLQISIFPQFQFSEVLNDSLVFAAGDPEMDAVLERMEDIRFHRNPLEVVLQFLPQGTRTTEVHPEDYRVHFYYYDEQGQFLGGFSFDLTYWRRWNFQQRDLPLYVLHGQEKGRELGAFLWEMTRVNYGLT